MDADGIEPSSLTQYSNNASRLFAILIRRKAATSLSLLILHKTFSILILIVFAHYITPIGF